MSDYISREELKERLVYCRGLGRTSLEAVLKAMDNTPTLDEKEIIRKPFERVVERLEEYRDDFMENVYQELDSDSDNNRANRIIEGFDSVFEIIKEECGINE